MPDKKKIVLPIAAAIGLVLLLWLAFHDRSGPARPVKAALAAVLSPPAPSRTPARTWDPASSRS
jgi:hypothetical protein